MKGKTRLQNLVPYVRLQQNTRVHIVNVYDMRKTLDQGAPAARIVLGMHHVCLHRKQHASDYLRIAFLGPRESCVPAEGGDTWPLLRCMI